MTNYCSIKWEIVRMVEKGDSSKMVCFVGDGNEWLVLKHDGLACQCLGKDLHTTTQMKGVMKSWLLDIVVWWGMSIFELLAGEDQALLVRWDTLPCLGSLPWLYQLCPLDLESDHLAHETNGRDLHTTMRQMTREERGVSIDSRVGDELFTFTNLHRVSSICILHKSIS